jgi:cytosine/adenosine deaminase-related metal-dependent hydrolase
MGSPPIENAFVRMHRGRIVAVGSHSERPSRACVDLGDAIILPGLVNAHTHLEFSSLDAPLAADGGLPRWIARVVAMRRDRVAHGDTIKAIRRGLTESAAAGVTTIGEIATLADPRAYAGPGPRVRVYCEGLGLHTAAIDVVPRAIAASLDAVAAAGTAVGISPHAPYSVAGPLGRRLLDAARSRDIPVAMHLLESEAEAELLAQGAGPFRRLLEDLGAWDSAQPPQLLSAAEWIGRLAKARRGIVVHATHIERDPVALLRLARHRDRLAVVVCPRTTQSLSGTLPPVPLLAAAGIRVAMGTDSRASNPDLSLLAECRALVGAGLVSAEEALRMATVHGAWALALEDHAGRILTGRPADLVVLRPRASFTDPFAAAIDPGTVIAATLRRGRVIAGSLPVAASTSPGDAANEACGAGPQGA